MLLLAAHLLDEFRRTRPTHARGFSASARRALLAHDWPGNVRELSNRIHRASVMGQSKLISPEALGLPSPPAEKPLAGTSLGQARDKLNRETLESMLRAHPHNMTRVAQRMGISRATLYRMMRKLDIKAGGI